MPAYQSAPLPSEVAMAARRLALSPARLSILRFVGLNPNSSVPDVAEGTGLRPSLCRRVVRELWLEGLLTTTEPETRRGRLPRYTVDAGAVRRELHVIEGFLLPGSGVDTSSTNG